MAKKPVWTPRDIAKAPRPKTTEEPTAMAPTEAPPAPAETPVEPPVAAAPPEPPAASTAPKKAPKPARGDASQTHDQLADDLHAMGVTVPFEVREGRRFKFILVKEWPTTANWPLTHAAFMAKGYIVDLENGACWFSDRPDQRAGSS